MDITGPTRLHIIMVRLGVTLSLDHSKPISLDMNEDKKYWQMLIDKSVVNPSQLRLVTSINKEFYFAEIVLKKSNGN